jgi:hypothetical protein
MRNRPGSIKHQDNAAFGTYPQGFRRRTAGKLTRQVSIFGRDPEDAFTVAVSWPDRK